VQQHSHHEPAIAPAIVDRPPRYFSALRAFDLATREACALTPDLHDLIGLHAIGTSLQRFVAIAAECGDAPEVALRRVKTVLRCYERNHGREHAMLVRSAIATYYAHQPA
jgi:hypothetical protein